MRISLGLLLVGSFSLAACSGVDGGSSIKRAPGSDGPPAVVTPPDPTTGKVTQAVGCPATVPAAKAISTSHKSATDVRLLLGGDVIYRDGQTVYRADAKAPTPVVLYGSPDLVHAFADDSMLVTVESPNPPDAVLKFMPVGVTTPPNPQNPNKLPGQDREITATPTTPWSAGGSFAFASDATSVYFLADVANQGDTIYKVDKANPNVMTQLANLNAPLTDPQLAGNDVWFVRDQKRVYRVTMTPGADPLLGKGGGTASEPTEVFASGFAGCQLAVGGSHAFCSTGKALEQRDLSGANVTTVFDSQTGATPSLLGGVIYGGDSVFVRSLPSSATDTLKNGIRLVKGASDDKLIACGREAITSIAVDANLVVWAEQGKGVFQAQR